jgi:hypothetical protein
MLKDYDYSPLHYRLMHAMVQPALGPECVTVAGVRRVCPSPQIFSKMRIGRSIHPSLSDAVSCMGQAVHTALTLYLYFIATALPSASYDATAASPPPPAAAARRLDEAETEGAWVRRWDAVAGGAGADWATCLRLLERAAADVALDGAVSTAASSTRVGGGVSSFRVAN